MANTPFAFPPPPPPPPKLQSHSASSQSHYVNGSHPPSRDRNEYNNHRENHHVEFRGPRRGPGNFRGRTSHSNGPQSSRNGSLGPPPRAPTSSYSLSRPSSAVLEPTLKRDHVTAFSSLAHASSRPKAPPAVPSFNRYLDHLTTNNSHPSTGLPPALKPVKQAQKQNLLGLTPAGASDSESDAGDDEQQLARSLNKQGLEVEYNGQVSTLKSTEEIAAWIAERKKRYPTQAKVAAAQKEAEQRKQQLDEERKVKREEAMQKREDAKRVKGHYAHNSISPKQGSRGQPARSDRPSKPREGDSAKPQFGLLKARQNLETAEDRLRKLEEEQIHLSSLPISDESKAKLEKAKSKEIKLYRKTVIPQLRQTLLKLERGATKDRQELPASSTAHVVADDAPSVHISDSDWTSSSDSASSDNDSDSDSTPEESTTKSRPDSALVSGQTAFGQQSQPRIVCKYMARYGKCKAGHSCKFAHDTSSRDAATPPSARDSRGADSCTPVRGKGLFQVFMDKEKEEEQKKVVRAIIALGEQGLLEEASK